MGKVEITEDSRRQAAPDSVGASPPGKPPRPTTVRASRRSSRGNDEPTAADYKALAEFRYRIRRFLRFSELAARAEGLEPQQHQALLAIRALDQPDIRTLANYLMIRHHSAVGLIDRLEERRLAERRRNASDRRQAHAVLTAEGAERLRRLSIKHRGQLQRSGPGLVQTLRELLEGWFREAAGPSSGDPKENVLAVPK